MSQPAVVGDDQPPVVTGEWLLRRFPSEPGQYNFSSGMPQLAAMIPTMSDVDGLSMNRERFISGADLLAAASNPNVREHGGVLALLFEWLKNHGLTAQPDPADTPGHVIIPGLS